MGHPERPLTALCIDQSLHTSGVVGSADPREFSTPVARGLAIGGVSLAQLFGLLESLLSSQAGDELSSSPRRYYLGAHTNDNTSARDGVRVRFPFSALRECLR